MWMGYGVHGNEPSASNAAPLIAYHLATSQSEMVKQQLQDSVILLDPCLNPDGFERFAHWANNFRGNQANVDPQHREHVEGSPTGRTNYYWFDLNRDWLPAQHPESQGRLQIYHQWLPNVVLDYHEMGANSTYFFQPGVVSRTHPLTPQANIELTKKFARHHATALDQIGSLYFTEERFDDYYMGKGSTYPDLHGGVGILFEQASSRGQRQETENGILEFPFAIRNQVRTSLSSLEALQLHRVELNTHLRDFYGDSLALARNAKVQGYLFSAGKDKARADEFLRVLQAHGIRVHALARDVIVASEAYDQETSYLIPAQQPEFRFLQALTERRKEFSDKVFYDITAWSLPLAFGLRWTEVSATEVSGSLDSSWIGDAIETRRSTTDGEKRSTEMPAWENDDYAYLLRWDSLHAPRVLHRLLEKKVQVKVAEQPFQLHTNGKSTPFSAGTLLIPLGSNIGEMSADNRPLIQQLLEKAVKEDGVQVHSVKSGLTSSGIDLGSDSFSKLELPRVLLLVGSGTSDYEAGEVWHLFDQRLQMPVTMVESHLLSSLNLDGYSTVVLVSGTYSNVQESGIEKLRTWLRRGGTLIALGTSSRWLNTKKVATIEIRERPKAEARPTRLPYGIARDFSALRRIEGTIFNTILDVTHPLTFGVQGNSLPVFRDHDLFLEPTESRFSTPAAYADVDTVLSGYAAEENVKLAAGSAAMLVKGEGAGRVIAIPNNPIFRGFWLGSQRLLVNSIFFGPIVRDP
jgi:hypothetical protein